MKKNPANNKIFWKIEHLGRLLIAQNLPATHALYRKRSPKGKLRAKLFNLSRKSDLL